MIAEFALTPSIFDDGVHPDAEAWREQLRELGNAMFPRTAAWPVMVADLYDGSWHGVALATAKAIKDRTTRILCEKILENIGKTLVYRPSAIADWPDNDVSWGREALASDRIESIDRIVCCRPVHTALANDSVRSIDEVVGGGFWSDVSSQWPQALTIADQIQAVRKLCLHSEFLCLITPYIRGTRDDETEFALEMIRSALTRPPRFQQPEIEIHAEGPEDPGSSDFSQRLRNAVANISLAVQNVLPRGRSVRLRLWPHFVDRYLIAGVYTETSSGVRLRSPRWGISMQHIARRADSHQSKPPTSWALLSRSQLSDVFDRFCSGNETPLSDDAVAGR